MAINIESYKLKRESLVHVNIKVEFHQKLNQKLDLESQENSS